MEVGQFIESFMSFLKLRKGCAIYRKIDCSTVRLSTVLVLWTHEHFTIVLMAYLWQLGSRRALRRGLFISMSIDDKTKAVGNLWKNYFQK